MTTNDSDDPVRRVLARIDALLHDLGVRGQALQEVRDLLRDAAGEGRPDGWLQVETRPDAPE